MAVRGCCPPINIGEGLLWSSRPSTTSNPATIIRFALDSTNRTENSIAMSTVTYKNQSGIEATQGHVPLAGTSHLYTVKKVLWPEAVTEVLSGLLIPRSLHVCCGKSLLGDLRLDADPTNNPDVVADASKLPFDDESFESVLCDPPYNGKFQWNHDLLKELSRVARKRIIFQHWFIPADNEGQWKKWHKFSLSEVYVWQPRTYFGRVQVISVFDSPCPPIEIGEVNVFSL